MLIHIPVSAGELVDKITILRIKAARLKEPEKIANVRFELTQLEAVFAREIPSSPELEALVSRLQAINSELWDIEDEKRSAEKQKCFGERFIALARCVYLKNDERAAIRKEISLLVGSRIVEEKSHFEG